MENKKRPLKINFNFEKYGIFFLIFRDHLILNKSKKNELNDDSLHYTHDVYLYINIGIGNLPNKLNAFGFWLYFNFWEMNIKQGMKSQLVIEYPLFYYRKYRTLPPENEKI